MTHENKKQKKSLAEGPEHSRRAIDKVKTPPKDSPQYDYVGVLLEAQQKDSKIIIETLNLITKKVNKIDKIEETLEKVKIRSDATFEIVGEMKVEMTMMNEKLDEHTEKLDDHTRRLDKVDGRLDKIEDKLGIKEEVFA